MNGNNRSSVKEKKIHGWVESIKDAKITVAFRYDYHQKSTESCL